MLRFACVILISACILLSLAPIAFSIERGKSNSGYTVRFEDDFEQYDVGAFPDSAGWKLWFDGAGDIFQTITETVSVSPSKSLQLLGLDGWAAFAAKRFTSDAIEVGFEVEVRVEQNSGGSSDDARVCFTKWTSPSTSRDYSPVVFLDNGSITAGHQFLQSYVVGQWYKVTQILDRSSNTFSVWIGDRLVADSLPIDTSQSAGGNNSYEIEAFSVSQCYNNVRVYFDDVKIFASRSMLYVPEVGGTITATAAMIAAFIGYLAIPKLRARRQIARSTV